MASIKFKISNLRLTTPVLEMQRKIKKAIANDFQSSVLKAKLDDLNQKIANFFYRKFLESDTFVSLLYGELRAEFGFSDDYLNNLESIVAEIVSTYLYFDEQNKKEFLKITIGIADNESLDYNELGVYYTEKDRIHWLYWLLTQGTTDVVAGHNVLIKQGIGRSHMAIMIPDDYVSYSVDPQYAGIEGDNWITRTLNANKNEFLNMIKEAFNGS